METELEVFEADRGSVCLIGLSIERGFRIVRVEPRAMGASTRSKEVSLRKEIFSRSGTVASS